MMPSYTMRRVQVTRREFEVPCYGEGVWDGCAHVEVEKAIAAARQELATAGVDVFDDTVKIRPGDGSVVVYYLVEEGMPDTALAAAHNEARVLRTQLRATERELADLIGDPGAELSATTLARLESQLGGIQRALRTGG